MDPILKGMAFASVGLVSLTAGGIWSATRPPGARWRSLIQHLAAGTVFAGLVVDVFRRLLTTHLTGLWLITGLILGLAAMITIRVIAEGASGSTLGFTIVADVITDGLLMGLTSTAGGPSGILFIIGLAPEMTLLGATIAAEFARDGPGTKKIAITALTGCAAVAGGGLGGWARSGPPAISTVIEAFGAIAISYLVMEELLREAHEQSDSPLLAATFFLGFIPLFAAGVLLG